MAHRILFREYLIAFVVNKILEKQQVAHAMTRRDRQIWIGIASSILILFFFAITNCNHFENDLRKHGTILNAKITGDFFPAKGGPMQFRYEFIYEGKLHHDYSSAGVTTSYYFIDHYFPIIYSPKDGTSQLLIIPKHFEMFSLKFPDSLNWVKSYLINGF